MQISNNIPALAQTDDGNIVNTEGSFCTNEGFFCCGMEIGGAGGAQNLAGTLGEGNCAGTFDINMNDQDLLNLNRLVGSVGQSISYEACEHSFNADILAGVNDVCAAAFFGSGANLTGIDTTPPACNTTTNRFNIAGNLCLESGASLILHSMNDISVCGNLAMNSSSVTGADSICATNFYGSGANLTGISASDPTKLPLAGGTMSGAIAMGGFDVTGAGHVASSCLIGIANSLAIGSGTDDINFVGAANSAVSIGSALSLNSNGLNLCATGSLVNAVNVCATTFYGSGANLTSLPGDATKLPLAGGTMSGSIAMGSNCIGGATAIQAASGAMLNLTTIDTNQNIVFTPHGTGCVVSNGPLYGDGSNLTGVVAGAATLAATLTAGNSAGANNIDLNCNALANVGAISQIDNFTAVFMDACLVTYGGNICMNTNGNLLGVIGVCAAGNNMEVDAGGGCCMTLNSTGGQIRMGSHVNMLNCNICNFTEISGNTICGLTLYGDGSNLTNLPSGAPPACNTTTNCFSQTVSFPSGILASGNIDASSVCTSGFLCLGGFSGVKLIAGHFNMCGFNLCNSGEVRTGSIFATNFCSDGGAGVNGTFTSVTVCCGIVTAGT